MLNKQVGLLCTISVLACGSGVPAAAAGPDYCIEKGGGVVRHLTREIFACQSGEWMGGFCASGARRTTSNGFARILRRSACVIWCDNIFIGQ